MFFKLLLSLLTLVTIVKSTGHCMDIINVERKRLGYPLLVRSTVLEATAKKCAMDITKTHFPMEKTMLEV
jgi:hypothetical protein